MRATASADDVAPASGIDSVAIVRRGDVVTTYLTGSAADGGGGVVAAVEVSVDGGATWHPAVGRTSWRYEWRPGQVTSEVSVLTRAVDDSGNLEAPGRATMVEIPWSSP